MVWSLQHPVPFVGSCQAGRTGTFFSVHLHIHFWVNSAHVGMHFWINSGRLHAHFLINLVCLHAHFWTNSVRSHVHVSINMWCWQRLGPRVGQFSWGRAAVHLDLQREATSSNERGGPAVQGLARPPFGFIWEATVNPVHR